MLFWTADEHYFHNNIIRYCSRPFGGFEEMNEVLIENHNKIVTSNDTTIHVGDFCLSKNKSSFDDVVRRLNGKHIFLRGSHDYFLPQDNPTRREDVVEGNLIVADHYPILNWPRSHYGSWHVHGHVHNGKLPFTAGKCYNVGVDVNGFAPVSFEKLVKIMDGLPENHNRLGCSCWRKRGSFHGSRIAE